MYESNQQYNEFLYEDNAAEPVDMYVNEKWEQQTLNLGEAIMSAMYDYSDVGNRSSRSEFWWWMVFLVILWFGIDFLSRLIGVFWLPWLAVAAVIMPTFCVTVRRLHDIGRSGLWLTVAATGVGAVWLLILFLQRSQRGSNPWGEQPNLVRIN